MLVTILALFRISKRAVCAASAGKGMIDFHDYPDTKDKEPDHFSVLTCERCGKRFVT